MKIVGLGKVTWIKIDYGQLWNAINYQKRHSKYVKEATIITINYENILSALDRHKIGRQKQNIENSLFIQILDQFSYNLEFF